MSNYEELERLKFDIGVIQGAYIAANQKQALLNPLLENKELFESWDDPQRAAGLAALRWTLYSAIITDLHALLFDQEPKTASLEKVIKKLEKTELKVKLEEDYARCNDVNIVICNEELESKIDMDLIKKSYVESQNEELKKQFHKIHPQTIKVFKRFRETKFVKRVKKARDKMIAHHEVHSPKEERETYKPESFGLEWGDTRYIVQKSRIIINHCYLLINGASTDINYFIRVHKERAECFWGLAK